MRLKSYSTVLASILVSVAGWSGAALAQAVGGKADPAISDGLVISDATAWFGWLATILLTLNLALGVLQPLR